MKNTYLMHSLALTSVIGFLIAVFYVSNFSATWSFAFSIVFVILFIASLIQMAHGEAVLRLEDD